MTNPLRTIPTPKPIALPKPIKTPAAPKLASIHITPTGGGFKVQHNMTHGPKPVPFVFSDPWTMGQHLKRIQSSQWRRPDRNVGQAAVHVLDLQE